MSEGQITDKFEEEERIRYAMLQLEQRFVIDEAINGLDALEKFKNNLFESPCHFKGCINNYYKLIIMDLNMPVMDGFESTQQIFAL